MPPKKKARVERDWTWAGTLVTSAEAITAEHRRRAAGLADVEPCKTSFPQLKDGRWVVGQAKDPMCKKQACRSNPRCYNHVGINEVSDPAAKEAFVGKVGEEPEMREGPAGLRNLGATCYANAFLQLWFHNVAFRNGLYACDLVEGSKLYHLTNTFGFMQLSQRETVDPSGLVKALQLNEGEQQDAGEFSQLFMSLIEEELGYQHAAEARGLIRRLFGGKIAYETTCQGCNASSTREENAHEIVLNLKDGSTLADCLTTLMRTEDLTGDNQYRCGSCDRKCDAERRTLVCELGDYVQFGLLRFTFDVKAGERRKSKASIHFPLETILGGVHYELQAVIVHQGTSPYQGHFICELLDHKSGDWFSCSDETLTRMDPSKIKMVNGHRVSRDAYLLVYKRRDKAMPAPVDPPAVIQANVVADNAVLDKDREQWLAKSQAAATEFDEMRRIKEPVIGALQGTDCIVPRDELVRWMAADMAGIGQPFSYDSVACEHGGVDPYKARNTVLVSKAACDLLTDSPVDLCLLCIEEEFRRIMASHDHDAQRDNFDQLNQDPKTVVMSKQWLKEWRQGRISDQLPTDKGYSLYCPHDLPWVNNRPFELISANALAVLQSAAGNFDTFSDSDDQCAQCIASASADNEEMQKWVEETKRERALRLGNTSVFAIIGEPRYVLPYGFIEQWMAWSKEYQDRAVFERTDVCEHGGVTFDPRRDRFRAVPEKQWDEVQKFYGEQMPVVVRVDAKDVAKVTPATCAPCRTKRLLVWDQTEVRIVLGSEVNPGATSSRRSTRPKMREVMIEVKKDTAIKDLRVDIMKATGAIPLSQRLTRDGELLEDASKTMRDLGILANDVIHCIELHEVEDDEGLGRPKAGPEGFHGTALLGGGGAGKRARDPSEGGAGGSSRSTSTSAGAVTSGNGNGNGSGSGSGSTSRGDGEVKEGNTGGESSDSTGDNVKDEKISTDMVDGGGEMAMDGVDGVLASDAVIQCRTCTLLNHAAALKCDACDQLLDV